MSLSMCMYMHTYVMIHVEWTYSALVCARSHWETFLLFIMRMKIYTYMLHVPLCFLLLFAYTLILLAVRVHTHAYRYTCRYK